MTNEVGEGLLSGPRQYESGAEFFDRSVDDIYSRTSALVVARYPIAADTLRARVRRTLLQAALLRATAADGFRGVEAEGQPAGEARR